ncbi:BnaC03g63670D [Brassica napus]|uniref:BnaC03g63670D protein n=1 Tax=Brassica napus TaxID=3708 RepID=A0A078H1U0_BRANA|nr:BnaC03g63670D [Brassica napus]
MDADSFWHSKYFFNIRLCVGAELFALTSDISKSTPDTVSV